MEVNLRQQEEQSEGQFTASAVFSLEEICSRLCVVSLVLFKEESVFRVCHVISLGPTVCRVSLHLGLQSTTLLSNCRYVCIWTCYLVSYILSLIDMI